MKSVTVTLLNPKGLPLRARSYISLQAVMLKQEINEQYSLNWPYFLDCLGITRHEKSQMASAVILLAKSKASGESMDDMIQKGMMSGIFDDSQFGASEHLPLSMDDNQNVMPLLKLIITLGSICSAIYNNDKALAEFVVSDDSGATKYPLHIVGENIYIAPTYIKEIESQLEENPRNERLLSIYADIQEETKKKDYGEVSWVVEAIPGSVNHMLDLMLWLAEKAK